MSDKEAKTAMAAQPDLFYPLVPDIDWLAKLLPLGVRTIQLRLKDVGRADRQHQIKTAIELCADHGCQLIVNDYWRDAIELGASFIHLGQEDLADADLSMIKAAGLKLGISTHSPEELQIALRAQPDYVALGPVYETKLKVMTWAPQGLDRLRDWKQQLANLPADLPLVAIGGITPARAPDVLAAGADSIAVITDFFTHKDPAARVTAWLDWASRHRC